MLRFYHLASRAAHKHLVIVLPSFPISPEHTERTTHADDQSRRHVKTAVSSQSVRLYYVLATDRMKLKTWLWQRQKGEEDIITTHTHTRQTLTRRNNTNAPLSQQEMVLKGLKKSFSIRIFLSVKVAVSTARQTSQVCFTRAQGPYLTWAQLKSVLRKINYR